MKKNLVKELQRLAKNLANIETNNNNAVGVLYELNNALENESAEAGGNEPLILEFATEDPYTVDTPLSEIKAAIETGRQVWFTAPTGDNLSLTLFSLDGANIASLKFEEVSYNKDTGWKYDR